MIVYENGNVVDHLKIRNDEIKEKLEDTLATFLREKEAMMCAKKPVNMGYRFTKQIYATLVEYGMMKADVFSSLTYDDINDYWLKYQSLTAYYNKYFEIVDNKQLFMTFMGINSRQYSQLEKSTDEDISNLMLMINNAFVGLGFVAGESGNANPLAVKQRLGAKNDGHSVVSATDEMLVGTIREAKSPTEITREVAKLLGTSVKNS